MRRRPQPSVRRGLLRAAGAVVGLTIILLAIIVIVSTVTAPKAKAPTVPPTPTAGTPAVTPGKGTVTPTPRAKPTATSTAKKPKKTSMMSGADLARRVLAARAFPRLSATSPDGKLLLFFRTSGRAYARNSLILLDRTTGTRRQVGYGDPFVRPIWSRDGSAFLYARVAETSRFPGASWTLVRGDTKGHAAALARLTSLSLVPLGWSGGQALFLSATATDTSLFAAHAGHAPRFLSILFPQVVTGASLSPDGNTIAFTVPTGCAYCTVDLFHLQPFRTVYGPSGWGSDLDLAWSADGTSLVTVGHNGLAVVNAATGAVRQVPAPKGLPRVWPHAMKASLSGHVTLTDSVTGATFTDSP